MVKIFIDAKDAVIGRLASFAAKQAINGDEVMIVNAEKAVISGSKSYVLKKYHEKITRGTPTAGPFYPRTARAVMKRVVRGMLPYKENRGRKAFKRIKVFEGIPEQFVNNTLETPVKTKHDYTHKKYITLQTLVRLMGKSK